MRVARQTLRALPVHGARGVWVRGSGSGLGTAEVALAMSLTPIEIESLAGRARRSLVLAVGGLEPAVGCAAHGPGSRPDRSVARERCTSAVPCAAACGGPCVRRWTRRPNALRSRSSGNAWPARSRGSRRVAAVSSQVLTAKAAAAPLLAKTAAIVVAALATAGVARQEIHHAASSHPVVAASAHARGGEAHVLAVAPAAKVKVIARARLHGSRQVAATTTVRPRAQVVALAVPTVSHVRGGAASTVGAGAPRTSHASSSGERDSGHSDRSGGGGGSDGNAGGEHDHSGSGDKPMGGSASETPPAKTNTSGNDDRPSTSRHGEASRSSKDGSGNDGGATSDGSGEDPPPSGGSTIDRGPRPSSSRTSSDDESAKGRGVVTRAPRGAMARRRRAMEGASLPPPRRRVLRRRLSSLHRLSSPHRP